ncbi:hypothetical protein, partial [Pseudomonas putida]|uniref:hypothetical protein n=1 Tax=Pseudomonas putida TaxID=303 RepID=UPI002022DBC5
LYWKAMAMLLSSVELLDVRNPVVACPQLLCGTISVGNTGHAKRPSVGWIRQSAPPVKHNGHNVGSSR